MTMKEQKEHEDDVLFQIIANVSDPWRLGVHFLYEHFWIHCYSDIVFHIVMCFKLK